MSDGQNDFIDDAVRVINDPRIKIHKMLEPTGFWGHFNRKKALYEYASGEFVLQTSIQDYYLPNAVLEILEHEDDSDIVYFDCLHNHFGHDVFNTRLSLNHIDWGCFAVRTTIARDIGINDCESSGCDGLFVEKCVKHPSIRIKKIEKILSVHN